MSANDLYALPSEYNDLRESVRALAENEIAPHAAAVDEDHRYPQEAADAYLRPD
jgi:alkylation response protein AidB-like acyl-CoA dehydrogenase